MPDARTLLAGLYAGGPELVVDSGSEGAVVRLSTADGRPLVSVEVPVLVQVPGEAARLLGLDATDTPLWWTEVRAVTAEPEAAHLAGSVAGRLTAVLGGMTWPPSAGHTEVVQVPVDGADSPDSVDILTDRAAVVFQERPVVAATTWLTDLLQSSVEAGRELQIVTPPETRLTLPTRTILTGLPARWVVRNHAGAFYDGLNGTVVHWQEGHFTPVRNADGGSQMAEAFNSPTGAAPEGERQMLLSIRTAHPATGDLLLGGALESAWEALTGALPAGWSTSEPVNLPWSRRQLTELARTRAQKSAPTWLIAVGAPDRPAIATLRIVRTPAGVEEHITLALGHTADEPPPLDSLPALAETLTTRHNLASMFTHLRSARADLTTPPHREGLPIPVSFTLGPDAVRAVGHELAESAPRTRPARLGPAARPALHYALGDGSDAVAWQHLKQLNDHLQSVR
ncbi:DUF6177 family protein [Streptomyces bottropensis]|uniref:DUF6177 family protein n=1 Tax=Streptomyces bottropensis TaxID=42235 RepID=A0ABU8AHW8_9ACTN